MALQLSPQMTELLNEVISKRCPHLANLLASPQERELTDFEREELREAVADEFCEAGLRENDEPNERGRLLEGLIGRLRGP